MADNARDMAATSPFLIIGQGLAGTALAWRLWQRGVPFRLVDREQPGTCSQIAAGLVTPITGMRLNLNWRFVELNSEAVAFYREVEARTGGVFYHAKDQVRLFRSEEERALFRRRLEDPALAAQVTQVAWDAEQAESLLGNAFQAPFGGFEQRSGGFLDTAAYLAASRAFFSELGCQTQGEVRWEDLTALADGVRWREESYAAAVFCQGWEAARNPWFEWVPFQSARGSILSARPGDWTEERVINGGGCWLLRRPDGSLRAGPTYEPRFDAARPQEPDPEKVAALRQRLAQMLQRSVSWEEVHTAVRPIVKRAKLLVGRHPSLPRVGFFNGLGSKGALRAPWAARQWVEHWLDGAALEAEIDLNANW